MFKHKVIVSNRKGLSELLNYSVRVTSNVFCELSHLYQEWICLFDFNCFYYSFNELNFLNEITDWLVKKGFHVDECKEIFQEISNRIKIEIFSIECFYLCALTIREF